MRAVAAALLATAALAAGCGDDPAPAPAAVPAAQRDDVLRRAQELVAVTPAELGYTVATGDAQAAIRAQTDTTRRTITLYLRRGDAIHQVAHDLAHEIGHAYDARRMSDTDRAQYLARRGVAEARWYPEGGIDDLDTGAGDFAEVFALCAAASPVFVSRLAPKPETPCEELPDHARRMLAR